MVNCSPSPQPEFWFTPANIAKIMCCLADAHIALKGCYVDDRFRLNANPKLEAPFLFVQYPIDFQWAGPAAFSDVDGRSDGHLWNANVDWFIFQKYDEAGNSRERHAQLTSQCWQIGLQILEKLRAVLRDSPYGWDVLTVNAMMMGEFSNTERWAKNLCGYGFQMVIQGVAAVDRCDQFFDEDKLDCICAPGTLPEPTPIVDCCDFIVTVIPDPEGATELHAVATWADPNCALTRDDLFWTWYVNDVEDLSGLGEWVFVDPLPGRTYRAVGYVPDAPECTAEGEYFTPDTSVCCQALQAGGVSLLLLGADLSMSVAFDPPLQECRDLLSDPFAGTLYRFLRVNPDNTLTVVQTAQSSAPFSDLLVAPPPGEYIARVELASGCVVDSEPVVVP